MFKKTLVAILICNIHLFANSVNKNEPILKYPFKESDLIQQQTPGGQNNRNTIQQETMKNKFKMNIDETVYQKAVNKSDKFNKLKEETINLDYIMQPEVRTLKSLDTLYIHPNHITTIVMPDNFEIKSGKSSFKTDVFELAQNSILIKPTKNFSSGNIILTATNKEKNYIFNFLIKKVEYSFLSFDSDYNKYLVEDNYLSLIYQYETKKKIDEFSIIQSYLTLNKIKGEELRYVFDSDGDYDMIRINGLTYYIIRDNRFGNIHYAGVNFRVDTKYSHNEKSNKIKRMKNE